MGKAIVVDSSVVVKWVSTEGEKWVKQADKILDQVRKGATTLFAPVLVKYEVGNAIRYKDIQEEQKAASLENFYYLPIHYVNSNAKEALDTLEIALGAGITYYDAVFVNLARKLGIALVTDNPKHQKKVVGVKVVALENY